MTTPIAYGTSHSADFEARTWTFEMEPGFTASAGRFAIVADDRGAGGAGAAQNCRSAAKAQVEQEQPEETDAAAGEAFVRTSDLPPGDLSEDEKRARLLTWLRRRKDSYATLNPWMMQEIVHRLERLEEASSDIHGYHDWIRGALGLPPGAPFRFDFYAQEIRRLRDGLAAASQPPWLKPSEEVQDELDAFHEWLDKQAPHNVSASEIARHAWSAALRYASLYWPMASHPERTPNQPENHAVAPSEAGPELINFGKPQRRYSGATLNVWTGSAERPPPVGVPVVLYTPGFGIEEFVNDRREVFPAWSKAKSWWVELPTKEGA